MHQPGLHLISLSWSDDGVLCGSTTACIEEAVNLGIWCKEREDESFIYFFGILKHLLNINQLVRSIREASFDLFVASLKQLCPLLFALDHIHYYRWIPVFILNLKLLNVSDPAHYHSFSMK